ncbi:hypothetical protein [Novispirillum itersonii]|uniref:Uncharacterized protein n=1 Tax=Novispirillum itersonii TaxID=189 RepID=A0A7W9ZD69_NOVIT|nr:hypothetical protein [Novispirillum itersonii]MBB6209185.1 hypothetical protein [Novispirillum itersonii]
MQNYETLITLTVILVSAAVVGVAVWRDRMPPELGKIWHFPWRPLAAVAILAILLALAHLVTLLSGRPFSGRL